MKALLFRQLFLIAMILTIGCQEDHQTEKEIDQIDLSNKFDEDMINATKLVDQHLAETGARTSSSDAFVAVTVIKLIDDKLYYATNTGIFEGYQEITEETVTATMASGGYVYWYKGSGLSDLEQIDFDPVSESYLGDDSNEIYQDFLWTINIPEENAAEPDEAGNVYLKYDIVYDYPGNTNGPIRLDPKIKVPGHDND